MLLGSWFWPRLIPDSPEHQGRRWDWLRVWSKLWKWEQLRVPSDTGRGSETSTSCLVCPGPISLPLASHTVSPPSLLCEFSPSQILVIHHLSENGACLHALPGLGPQKMSSCIAKHFLKGFLKYESLSMDKCGCWHPPVPWWVLVSRLLCTHITV